MNAEERLYTKNRQTKGKKMTKRNPKQEGSNLFDCKPQSGLCPLNCNQCFYNRPNAFYIDPMKPYMPTVEEVGNGIMRVNCGHDSNIEREKVIKETAIYKHRFFNTSIPKFDFPAPVVLTANPKEEKDYFTKTAPNLMFVRLRVSSTNLNLIDCAVKYWSLEPIPVVLTFMAYYTDPPTKKEYEWKVRHINSYWCPTRDFMAYVLEREQDIGGRGVTMCGTLESNFCKDCRNCETYYWQSLRYMSEIGEREEDVDLQGNKV